MLTISGFRSNAGRAPQDIDASVIGAAIGYGATDRLEVFGSLGVNRLDVDDLTQTGRTRDYPFIQPMGSSTTAWLTGVGDAFVGATYSLLDDRPSIGDDLAASVRVKLGLPTADDRRGLGPGIPTFSTDLLLAHRFPLGIVTGAFGFGFSGRHRGLDIGRVINWGIGVSTRVEGPRMRLNAEVAGQKIISGDCPRNSPIDFAAGPSFVYGAAFFKIAAEASLDMDGRFAGGSSHWHPGFELLVGFTTKAGS